ncbi:MAG: ABC transporter permease [Gemmatimonas sp.]
MMESMSMDSITNSAPTVAAALMAGMAGNLAVAASLEATVRWATPFGLAALGECVSERAGVINIGLEGSIIAGALGATIGAGLFGPTFGFACGALSGLLIAAFFALFAVTLRSDQIITGTAITMFALGLTGTLYRLIYGASGVSLTTPTSGAWAIPGLSAIPLIGPAFFNQPPITYLLYLAIAVVSWWMSRTGAGLALRAVGERPEAAAAAGIRVQHVQWAAVLFAGLMAGLAGATLVLAQAGTFVEHMSAGRGFIAIAIVVLGRWRPLGIAAASLLFGAAYTLQNLFQSMGLSGIPYNLFLAAPYVLTLIVLSLSRSGTSSPAALGQREIVSR